MVLPRGNGRLQPQYTGSNRQATNDPNAENKRVLGDLHVVIPKRPAAENPRQPLRQPLTNRQRLPQASEKPQSRQLIAKRPQPQHPNYNDQRHFAQRRSRRHFVVDDLDVPKIMIHRECKEYYTKLEYLGEGGYAKCYRVKNTKGEFFAIKVITKVILQDTRTRNQLFSEINIHRSLNHCSIVKFYSCFEDDKNVYLVVELCENGTLADMVRKRSRISELEVRYFLIQLLDACRYLHENRVIHRDIKLSNVFLNRNMDIKIGDFGLAALLVNREDRKRTFCGTPNYIAPEILCKKSGHDHKVDIWSIGVLMFTMLVGKHPFQRKDMKETFRQIRQNSEERAYEFPVNIEISQDAKDLIGKLLVNAPEQRPSVPDILSHAFFQNHPIPQFIPRSALYHKPSEQEICPSTEEPRAATSSPGRVAEAMRHAIDQKRSYVDRTPLGPLRIMSEYIPDLRSQFPIQDSRKPPLPPPLEPYPVPAASANRKRPASVDHAEASPRKREPKPRSRSPTPELDADPSLGKEVARTPPRVPAPVSVLETMMQVLTDAIDESVGWKGELGQEIKDILWSTENVFLEKWVDFSSKYGFGYTLTDGTHGALFNDSTTMLTKEENNSYLYITQNERLVKQIVQQDSPELTRELKKKMHLMDCFKKHMTDKHALPRNPNGPVSFVDTIFLSKYIATDRAVVFRLSNNVIQLNFFTHQKLVLTEYATKIIYIDENKELSMYLLTDAVTCGKKDIYDAIVYARNVLEEQVRQRLKTSKTEG